MVTEAIDHVKGIIRDTELTRRVVFSDVDEFLTYKKNFFPAAHVDITNVSVDDTAQLLTFQVLCVDTLDASKSSKNSKRDQLTQSLDTTLTVMSRLIAELKSLTPGSPFTMEDDQTSALTRVYEAGTQDYYGWEGTFVLSVANKAHNG